MAILIPGNITYALKFKTYAVAQEMIASRLSNMLLLMILQMLPLSSQAQLLRLTHQISTGGLRI